MSQFMTENSTTVLNHKMMLIFLKKKKSNTKTEKIFLKKNKNLLYLNNNDLQGALRSKHAWFNNSL